MRTVYTNISPITNAYTNINHFFYLKKHLNVDRIYLCIWDSFIFEDSRFDRFLDPKTNKFQKLEENVKFLEKILSHLGFDYRIIYLSEAWDRLFKKSNFSSIFQRISSKINMNDLKKGFDLLQYVPFGEITISKISYTIADFLIALNLHELFPEYAATSPDYYLVCERFKVFQKLILNTLEGYGVLKFPEIVIVKDVPVIMDKNGFIPSVDMNLDAISKILREYFENSDVKEKELLDFLNVLGSVLKNFDFQGGKISKMMLKNKLLSCDKGFISSCLALNLYNYFKQIKTITQKEQVKERSKSLFISEADEFNRYIKPLNWLKIKILQHCDGTNTSLDISKKTGLNFSTVSVYLGYLKAQKLITEDKRPRKAIQNIVINLEELYARGDRNGGT